MKTCPKCKISVRDEATMCPACGFGFPMFSLKSVLMILGFGVVLTFAAGSLIASLPRDEKIVVASPIKPLTTRNVFAESLPALKGPARATMLGKLMTKSGQPCTKVKRSFFAGSRDGLAFWNVRCEESGDWMIQVKNDSSITRVACNDHPEIKALCWKPL